MSLERIDFSLTNAITTKRVGGAKVSVRRLEGAVQAGSINHTAFHEACHVLAAFLVMMTVYKATDIPSADYGGATWVSDYDPRVAAAAEAMGCSGTGHDMWTVDMMGDSPTAAIVGAFALIGNRHDELNAIATEIQARGTASGSDMANAKDRVHTDVVEVTVEAKDGTTKSHIVAARANTVHVPVELPIQHSNSAI